MAGLSRVKSSRGTVHDTSLSILNYEWSILRMIVLRLRCIDHKPAIEAFPRSQLFFPNLMADRARHPIFRLGVVFLVCVERKVREDLSGLALQLRFIASDWHMADGPL